MRFLSEHFVKVSQNNIVGGKQLGTRSIVVFIQGNKKIGAYVHYDGYPDSRVPSLAQFVKWNSWRMTDLTYTVANYVAFVKMETLFIHLDNNDKIKTVADFKAELAEWGANSQLHTGIGIYPKPLTKTDLKGSWLEYAYDVHLPMTKEGLVKVECFDISQDSGEKTSLGICEITTDGKIINSSIKDMDGVIIATPLITIETGMGA